MRFFITYLLFFATAAFFNYKGIIPDQTSRHLLILVEIIAIVYALFFIKRNSLIKDDFNRIYIWMILFICMSIFCASIFHHQSIFDSVIILIPNLLAWLTFFVFLQFNFNYKESLKIIIFFVSLGIIAFLINHILSPNIIFSGNIVEDDSRGFFRIFLNFRDYVVLVFFLCVSKINSAKDIRWILFSIGLFTIILMMMIRQYLLFSSFLACLILLRKKTFINKLIIIVSILFFSLVILPQIEIFNGLMEYSKKQQEYSDDLDAMMRLRAWKFFIFNQTNEITPFLGNGFPWKGKSIYGQNFIQKVNYNGIYDVDAGWASFFWFYGIFATLCLIVLFILSIKKINVEKYVYIKYWLLFMIMVNCLSGGVVYNPFIPYLTFVFAMIRNNQLELSGKLFNRNEVLLACTKSQS